MFNLLIQFIIVFWVTNILDWLNKYMTESEIVQILCSDFIIRLIE